MRSLIVRNLLLYLSALLLVALPTQAARVNDLFQVEVAAGGRDAASRDAALGEALRQVLVRVTGSTESLQSPSITPLLKSPSRFAQQFRFREIPQEMVGHEEQLRLWVQFDGVALAREVRKAGLPYWGSERPDVLLWLAIDERGRRYLVSDNSTGGVARAVSQAAYRWALPLTLPLMDLEGQRAVQFTDVWGGFVGTLQAAGYWAVALDGAADAAWDTVDYKGHIALVVGAEGKGVQRLVRERCDFRVALPLRGHVASLNASAAFAAVMFEVVRQQAR